MRDVEDLQTPSPAPRYIFSDELSLAHCYSSATSPELVYERKTHSTRTAGIALIEVKSRCHLSSLVVIVKLK